MSFERVKKRMLEAGSVLPDTPRHSRAPADEATVQELLKKAAQNEQILKRYQRFELRLLDASGFSELLNLLLDDSLAYFQLDAIELWLYDPEQTVAEHIENLDDYSNLLLLPKSEPLKQLYGAKPSVQLVSLGRVQSPAIFHNAALRSAAMLPLVRQGVLVGSLHMGARGHKRFALDKSTDFINHLASVVAVCFENVVNQERLHRLSMYDMLTQVKNRRAFNQALEKEVSRASRNKELLSLLFVDLDHFKRINDSHGHPTGDRALKIVAQHINQMLRKTDHVCRYGGEEFALLLPNCSPERALEIAERIRMQVSQLPIYNDAGQSLNLTLSIGVSCWQPGTTACEQALVSERLVRCADEGVYSAKSKGRNTVEFVAYQQ
ncbi:DUF484 family protein [Dasania sp. GY-MA-18]|uniref:diguanylate cyclase n=1 Tax=Dasania phycosphaerae TaxID=2950436 RepID=A0A9J6RGJ2_9GAMM|nr:MULTISPECIES: sensor domain-containing diguanylate cyclase [Dasania]MCR8921168.1 DUF484 family protein [Dasania sp. GY-MA-18]MCZ0863596.1 sensor domain-containing diguanylate cyclase [Dasania phycosphaerae]MCZ0867324.1 sensor domain-containing diguanylate cyclase [Dasania phycosphaerae]